MKASLRPMNPERLPNEPKAFIHARSEVTFEGEDKSDEREEIVNANQMDFGTRGGRLLSAQAGPEASGYSAFG